MCSLEKRGKVYVLTLVGQDEEHRLNPTTFHAIAEALKEVEESPDAAALVTTNEGKHFSCGIDMKWVAESPLDHMDIAMEGLEKMLAAFMRLTVPTVAGIYGDVEARSFILTLAHDYCFMSSSSSSSFSELYMLELDNGLPIPRSMMVLISSKLSPSALRDIVLRVSKLKAQTAVEKGIVDDIFKDSTSTLDVTVKEAEKLVGRGWEREIYRGFRLATFPGVMEALDPNVPYRIPPSFKF